MLTFARQRLISVLPQHFVKGYIGMLEMEDTLHETAPLEVFFDQGSRATCQQLKKQNDQDEDIRSRNVMPVEFMENERP